jgi:hypothetical protein
VLAGLYAGGLQVVRQAVCARIELCVGQPLIAADDGGPVADGVGQGFEEVGKVEFHGQE